MNNTNSSDDRMKWTCCAVSFLFVFVILLGAICWTTCSNSGTNYDNFINIQKYNNDTLANRIMGGKHYKSLDPNEDLENYLNQLDQHKPVLIAILAESCGYCRQLKKSNALRKVSEKYPVVTMDQSHPMTMGIMQALKSPGFPTLAIFRGGKMSPYNGDRSAQTLTAAMHAAASGKG